ncbi:DNA polymerase I [Campylobacter sp. JMF_02 ED1]|uniref:DNA polymerase I n=1 Tax=unclassified Campylobacter TaxID=2593542 RepID=UPI0022E9C195|nr:MULTISPECIES: DNA polymerase I [unclassified Campylobacter]MDA3050054.1 DNA polymerase I [Campylobacter sp. JMF_15 NE4]MDA3051800.1 DNA polymerase I [Campylobacter sp. JMF_02 ED1]
MKTITIIDTFGFFFRLYYAMSSLKTKSGKPSGMVSGFANFIANLEREFKSDYIIFALDSKGKTFRSQIDPNYKTNRQTPPDALLAQLPVCIEMIEKMGFCTAQKEGFEADDLIASVVKTYRDTHKINIVTSDKDLYQLIGGETRIYSYAKKMLYGRDECYEKYGVYPEQIIDFLAICGDSADNIPGVKGIGEKGAKKLLDEWGSLERIYENIELLPPNKQREYLINSKNEAFMSQKLATLCDEVEISPLQNAVFPEQNPLHKIKEILREYELHKLLSALENEGGKSEESLAFKPVCVRDESELARLCEGISEDTIVAFDTETTGLDSKNAKIVGFSFCFNEQKAYYVPLTHNYLGVGEQILLNSAKMAIERIFSGFVVGQNLKYDFNIIEQNFGIKPPRKFADTMILAWLINPGESVGMDNLAKRYFDYDTIKFEDIVAKGETFASLEFDEATKYAAEDAWITLKFYFKFQNLLSPELLNLAKTLEFPFVRVLRDMENAGIKISKPNLSELISRNESALRVLTNEIYELSGESFNINSTKQLGVVLFEHLGLPCQKKTKTGYSTDESVLALLIQAHPVVEKILAYRELYKLQSTYCEPLYALAMKNENSRIYSNFMQTGTSTGRLSSKNPNLQNIPARGALAKDMRNCFIAQEGYSLLSLDYSQIELRLLAHFSKDPALLQAFGAGEDIHSRTAISIFGDSEPAHRAIAKSINFGLIYGMGASKLAQNLQIPRNEAKGYIERYFASFATIKEFLEGLKNSAKNDGFITTLFGRRRYFDFANASPLLLATYEREAVNTKFQGSAADIIKKAMVEISPHLGDEARLVLQIHDELIFEVKSEYAQEFGAKIREIMQNVVNLNVPLVTSLDIATSWGELK